MKFLLVLDYPALHETGAVYRVLRHPGVSTITEHSDKIMGVLCKGVISHFFTTLNHLVNRTKQSILTDS